METLSHPLNFTAINKKHCRKQFLFNFFLKFLKVDLAIKKLFPRFQYLLFDNQNKNCRRVIKIYSIKRRKKLKNFSLDILTNHVANSLSYYHKLKILELIYNKNYKMLDQKLSISANSVRYFLFSTFVNKKIKNFYIK